VNRLLWLAVGSLAWATSAPPSSTARLAKEIADRAVASRAEGPIAIVVYSSSPALSEGFSTLLAAALAQAKMGPVVLSRDIDAVQAARATGAHSLVRLDLRVESGKLVAQGDLLGTWVNFWSGKAPTRPPRPAALLRASVEADAEALALAVASAMPANSVAVSGEPEFRRTRLATLPLRTAALAAGDLDGDGRDEIVALTDEELVVFSPDGQVLTKRDLRNLASSAIPCREPFGSVVVLPRVHRVAYFSCRLGKGELLEKSADGTLRSVEMLDQAPIAVSGETPLWAKPLAGQNTFAPMIGPKGQAPVALRDNFSTLSTTSASPAQYLVVFPGGGGALARGSLADPGAMHLTELGAGSGLVDFDGGGNPSLVTSSSQYDPMPDQIRVFQLASAPALQWNDPVSQGEVLQIVGADLEGNKQQSAVVGVWMPEGNSEIQVIRRRSRQ
jgi:hypothetical protein